MGKLVDLFVEIMKELYSVIIQVFKFWEKHYEDIFILAYIIFPPILCSRLADKDMVTAMICLEIVLIVGYFVNRVAIGKNNKFPIPRKRFTRKYENQIRVENKDWEEMIMYVYELENYLERNGINENKK